jgi:phosphoglycerate dehydrogenase-like enzyme
MMPDADPAKRPSKQVKIVFRSVPPDLTKLDPLRALYPEAEFALCGGDANLADHLADAEVFIGGFSLSREMLEAAPKLRWVHFLGVGVEKFLIPELAERDIVLTNGRGITTTNLAEHAMALMLAFGRALPDLLRRQQQRLWSPESKRPLLFDLNGQRLCILGYGEIGQAVARRAKAFGMEVWALRRHAERTDPNVDRMLPPGALDELLAAADHLLIATPLTPDTRKMINAEKLAKLKPTAYLYNLARGAVVDQDALIAALRNKQIAGAGLDVTDPEPLPPDSPLWDMQNVIITGHLAGNTPNFWDPALAFIGKNLQRYRNGQDLLNPVDPRAGY